MKKAYNIILVALAIVVLSWFLPWLYSLALPDGGNEPFVGFSPISNTFIISESTGDGNNIIYGADAQGQRIAGADYTKNDRDSLLPQIYFTQLMARNSLPDSINGKETTMPVLKRTQWVFTNTPRNVNLVPAEAFMIMESMPERFDLEDAKEVFVLDGQMRFTAMEGNEPEPKRTERFTKALANAGFTYPARHLNADVTTRKAYDEGYLMVDGAGKLFHVKMQAGRPYVARFNTPDSVDMKFAFILENMDTQYLGLAFDANNNMYALSHSDYSLIPLPVGKVDPTKDRIVIMKNLFNWIVRINGPEESRWVALDSDTYRNLGTFTYSQPESAIARAERYIFPFTLSFTDTEDKFVTPRFADFSPYALGLNVVLALILVFVLMRGRCTGRKIVGAVCTVIFGLFAFIPFALLKD